MSFTYRVSDPEIVCYGTLDKRRDGAVRGGWATRLFILTKDHVAYYRVASKAELLGEEREHIPLSSVTTARVIGEEQLPPATVELPNEFVYLEIILSNQRQLLMRASKRQSAEVCHSWVSAIEKQQMILQGKNPMEEYQLQLTIEEKQAQLARVVEKVSLVALVNAERDEKVVARRVQYGEKIDLGVVKQGGACLIVMEQGSTARIGTQALMGTWDTNETCWIECVCTKSNSIEVEVSVICQVVLQNETNQEPLGTSAIDAKPSSQVDTQLSEFKHVAYWLSKVQEGASIGFLIMALLVHFMLGVQKFHWTHRGFLTLVSVLAITSLMNGSNSSNTNSTSKQVRKYISSSSIPKLKLTLIIHRTKQIIDGEEIIFPLTAE